METSLECPDGLCNILESIYRINLLFPSYWTSPLSASVWLILATMDVMSSRLAFRRHIKWLHCKVSVPSGWGDEGTWHERSHP